MTPSNIRMRLIEQQVNDLRTEFRERADELERSIRLLLGAMETGPENNREEVAPVGKNTTRDWCMARLATAIKAEGSHLYNSATKDHPPMVAWNLGRPLGRPYTGLCPDRQEADRRQAARETIRLLHRLRTYGTFAEFALSDIEAAKSIDALVVAAVVAERERCARIADGGVALAWRSGPIKFVSPEQFAADLARDIADDIRQDGTA